MNEEICKKENNLKNCPCKVNCIRKGICCECIEFHRKLNQVPACIKNIIENQNGANK